MIYTNSLSLSLTPPPSRQRNAEPAFFLFFLQIAQSLLLRQVQSCYSSAQKWVVNICTHTEYTMGF